MLEIVKIIAALLNIGFGVYAMLQTEEIAKASRLVVDSARGRTELRVTMAGYFIGMGVGAILLGSLLQTENAAYQVIGLAWLGGAVIRLLNIVLEDRGEIIDTSFWLLMGIELAVGIILVIPN